MKKSMHNGESRAFSLAEALITLLIVCLITLASIPILTKKKRGVDESSGSWMCTINSEGKYVVWDSANPKGDKKNPDTWNLSSEPNSCTFYPASKSKMFSVTLIGGGGGGATGVSKRNIFMDESTLSYAPPENGNYRFAIMGPGGGGSGSDDEDSSTNKAVGGQGGAGGYFVGEIKLLAGRSYSSIIPEGRPEECDDGSDAEAGRAADREFTQFKMDDIVLVKAGNGQGGSRTKNKGGADPKGGNGGQGGNIFFDKDNIFANNLITTYIKGKGEQGKANGNVKNPGVGWDKANYGKQNGAVIPKEAWGDNSSKHYGTGGYGELAKTKCGNRGEKGTVKVWQIVEYPGLGGSASPIESTVIASFKGSMKVQIGLGGQADQDGGITKAEILNIHGGVTRTLNSGYGIKGALGAPTTAAYKNGTKGQNSNWLDIGGGNVGECSAGSFVSQTINETTTVPLTDTSGNYICKVAYYTIGAVDRNKDITSDSARFDCPLNGTTNPKGVCLGFDIHPPFSVFEFNQKYVSGYLKMLDDVAYVDGMTSALDYSSLVSLVSSEYIFNSWYIPSNSTKYSKYTGINGNYDCFAYHTKSETVPKTTYTYKPAGCEDSANGTYFGAGGGGGSTSNQLGMVGKGGNGAPGAVIIEW